MGVCKLPKCDEWASDFSRDGYCSELHRLYGEVDNVNKKIQCLYETLEEVDRRLTNMQPVIANGLLDKRQLEIVDTHIELVLEKVRAVLKASK